MPERETDSDKLPFHDFDETGRVSTTIDNKNKQTSRNVNFTATFLRFSVSGASELTYSSTNGHEHVTDNLGVVHHDSLHRAIQHADLQRPLLLLVLQRVLS